MSRYEELRAYALCPQSGGSRPQGLTLLLRRGLPGWLEVWRQLSSAPGEVAAARDAVPAAPGEVATVLAGMVLLVIGG